MVFDVNTEGIFATVEQQWSHLLKTVTDSNYEYKMGHTCFFIVL